MKIQSYIKPKPDLFKYIPWLSSNVANTLYPFIFLPKEIYNNLVSHLPNQKYIALLVHEQFHYRRQQEMGAVVFGIKYLFSSKFRFSEELDAVKAAVNYLKQQNITVDIESFNLDNPEYLFLWPISKHYEPEKLKELYEKYL